MRYFKKGLEVYAFEENQLHLVDNTFSAMNAEEVDRHINPQNYMSDEEKLSYKRSQYPKLTRYQFMRGLLEMGFKSSDIEAQILLIEDEFTRDLTMLGFKDATNFERNNQSVAIIRDMLNKTDLELDEFWELCVTF